MKKIKFIISMFVFILMISNLSYAAIDNTLHFDVSYQGKVTVGEEKNANIILAGDNTPLHAQVLIKVEIVGPQTPKILATDSQGNEYDIAQLGSWGPPSGFAVQGTFTNETPVRATFTEAGVYTITLTLVDLQNANDILAQKTVTIQVEDVNTQTNQILNQVSNAVDHNAITELPKTGTSLSEYVLYIGMLLAIIGIGHQIWKRRIK